MPARRERKRTLPPRSGARAKASGAAPKAKAAAKKATPPDVKITEGALIGFWMRYACSKECSGHTYYVLKESSALPGWAVVHGLRSKNGSLIIGSQKEEAAARGELKCVVCGREVGNLFSRNTRWVASDFHCAGNDKEHLLAKAEGRHHVIRSLVVSEVARGGAEWKCELCHRDDPSTLQRDSLHMGLALDW